MNSSLTPADPCWPCRPCCNVTLLVRNKQHGPVFVKHGMSSLIAHGILTLWPDLWPSKWKKHRTYWQRSIETLKWIRLTTKRRELYPNYVIWPLTRTRYQPSLRWGWVPTLERMPMFMWQWMSLVDIYGGSYTIPGTANSTNRDYKVNWPHMAQVLSMQAHNKRNKALVSSM